MTSFESIYEKNSAEFLSGWKEFLAFKSISTDPAYGAECLRCAEWLKLHLEKIGLKVKLLETEGKPVVYAEFLVGSSKPTVVFYGHYDVQPVDPIELWQTDPFKAELRDGRLYARGAQDNKGQAFYVIKAVETLIKEGRLKCNLKLIIEGEEESSSKGFTKALPGWKDFVKGDLLLVCDTGMLTPEIPTITMGLRGIIELTARIDGPNKDLHSGVHGGVVLNPALELVRLLAKLHSSDGSIAVPGFYADCEPVDPEDKRLADKMPIDAAMYEKGVGIPPIGLERDLSAAVRRGFRPTIELNGIHSGYGGPGSKTIIPSFAEAKITSRLVAGQDPQKSLEQIINFLKENAPKELKFSVPERGVGGPAVKISAKSQVVKKAAAALQKIYNREVLYMWEGASIPVVTGLAKISGAEPVLVGFGLEEDNIHAPNESFALEQFRRGFLFVTNFLADI